MKTIVSIQVLRALAAIAVAIAHFEFDLTRTLGGPVGLPSMRAGDAGVDLFFVISGFVMVYATGPYFARAGGPSTFFVHRLIRIVPIYWFVTIIYIVLAAAVPVFGKSYSIEFAAASFFFVPFARPGGVVQPLVGQGWTLNYEMFFYVIFAFAVIGTRRTAVFAASCALIVIVVAGKLVAPLPLAFAFWSDPIIIEFVFGMLIALIYVEGVRLPKIVSLGFIIAGPLLILALWSYLSADPGLRLVSWGVPAALLVAGSTLGSFSPSGWAWRGLAMIGDASYALYLFHSFPIRAVIHLARAGGFDLAAIAWPLLMISVSSAVGLALAIHYAIERPVTKALRSYIRVPLSREARECLGTGEVRS